MKQISELSFNEIVSALSQEKEDGILFLSKVVIPEADIALCQYHGRRFNVKFDIDYGVEVDPVDCFSKEEISNIENLISLRAG